MTRRAKTYLGLAAIFGLSSVVYLLLPPADFLRQNPRMQISLLVGLSIGGLFSGVTPGDLVGSTVVFPLFASVNSTVGVTVGFVLLSD